MILSDRHKKVLIDELCATFFKQYYATIYRYCLYRFNYDRQAAEDCCQETFLTLYENLVKFKNYDHVKAWLYHTADNYINRYFRELSKSNKKLVKLSAENELSELVDEANSIELCLDKAINIEDFIEPVLEELTSAEQQLYELYFRQDIPIRELSQRLGISEHALSTRIYRLKGKIKQKIHKVLNTESLI